MIRPRKVGSGRATRSDHAANEWRKEAVANRIRLDAVDRRIRAAMTLILIAQVALDEDDSTGARNALTDALRFLTTDERKAS